MDKEQNRIGQCTYFEYVVAELCFLLQRGDLLRIQLLHMPTCLTHLYKCWRRSQKHHLIYMLNNIKINCLENYLCIFLFKFPRERVRQLVIFATILTYFYLQRVVMIYIYGLPDYKSYNQSRLVAHQQLLLRYYCTDWLLSWPDIL